MRRNELAAIEYHGRAHVTRACVTAVERLLLDEPPARALILTWRDAHFSRHALLLTEHDEGMIAIKSGFTSGYGGEGPRGFSHVLGLLDWHGIELDEVIVESGLVARLDDSALTAADLEWLEAAPRVRPKRVWDYIDIERYGGPHPGNPWRWSHASPLPYALIADPLADLALKFDDDPDVALSQAHRRLETRVRQRLREPQTSDLAGIKLYRAAFGAPMPRLVWPGVSAGEREGRLSLFIGAVMAYRNPRAHVEGRQPRDMQIAEFLLVNHLFALEQAAVDTSPDSAIDGPARPVEAMD